VVCGHDRYGDELSSDLRAEGLDVTVVHVSGGTVLDGEGDSAQVVDSGHVADAVAFVAATENDTTNLWLVEAAKRANPNAFVVALQNRRANAPLFTAIGVDFGMVPAEVIAHEVLARLANPSLMRFLSAIPHQSDDLAAELVDRLVENSGSGAPHLWLIRLDEEQAPVLKSRLDGRSLCLADLLRDPRDRNQDLDILALAMFRDGERTMAPRDHMLLQAGDELLLAGRLPDKAALHNTMTESSTASYVLDGRHVAASWIWRWFTNADKADRLRHGAERKN